MDHGTPPRGLPDEAPLPWLPPITVGDHESILAAAKSAVHVALRRLRGRRNWATCWRDD